MKVEPLTVESLKFPEGFSVDEPIRDEFLGIMNDSALTGADRAQKLIDLQAKLIQSGADAQRAAWDKTQEEWVAAAKNDPEVGGAKLEPALGSIAKLVEQYGGPELNSVFDLTGVGNNVHVIRFLSKIAKDLTENGNHVSGNPSSQPQSLAQSLYPSMQK